MLLVDILIGPTSVSVDLCGIFCLINCLIGSRIMIKLYKNIGRTFINVKINELCVANKRSHDLNYA